jgi:LmbE family N-acetylglucosaminyl deacetylase
MRTDPAFPPAPPRVTRRLQGALARAPIQSAQTLSGHGPLIILAPHPDDESIGCGALVASARRAGRPVEIHVMTDGRHSHLGSPSWSPDRVGRRRRLEVARAARRLGVPDRAVTVHGLMDGMMLFDQPGALALAARLARHLRRRPGALVLTTWGGEPHPDHVATAAIARMIRARAPGVRLCDYLVWTDHMETGLRRDLPRTGLVRMRMSPAERAIKRKAMAAHRSQTTRMIVEAPSAGTTVPRPSRVAAQYELYLRSPRRAGRARDTGAG